MIDNRVNFYNVQMRNTTKLIKVHTCYYWEKCSLFSYYKLSYVWG